MEGHNDLGTGSPQPQGRFHPGQDSHTPVMQDVGPVVEHPTQSMAAKIAHDAAALGFGSPTDPPNHTPDSGCDSGGLINLGGLIGIELLGAKDNYDPNVAVAIDSNLGSTDIASVSLLGCSDGGSEVHGNFEFPDTSGLLDGILDPCGLIG